MNTCHSSLPHPMGIKRIDLIGEWEESINQAIFTRLDILNHEGLCASLPPLFSPL